MSWLTRVRDWWRCASTPLPPTETLPQREEAEQEDDPDVKQVKQALETQITELLRAHPEAAPQLEVVKRQAEQQASHWLETQRRIWTNQDERAHRHPHEQAS